MKSNFPAFVRQGTLHILRERRTMLIVLLIPVVLMVLFGFAISTEVNEVRIAVVASDRTDGVREAVERIARNDSFAFCGYIPQERIEEMLRTGRVDAVAVFAPDYDRRRQPAAAGTPQPPVVQLILDASNVNTAGTSAAWLQGVLLGEASPQALFETRLLYNPQMKSAYNFVPGIMGLIFIVICAIMTSVSIVREKETGTMEVLLVSPVRPIRIILAKMIPYFVLSCLDLVTILLLARYVLGVPMSGSIVGIVSTSLLYLALALALGLFISTTADRQITALIISTMLMLLPLIMLSGMVFPIENMPWILRTLSCIIPARWYIDAIRKLMIAVPPFAAVARALRILAGITLALVHARCA